MTIDDECSHNSPSADQGDQLDSIYGSNKTVESPSVVSRKRKNTDEGDASKMIPWELYLEIQEALKLRKRLELVSSNKFVRELIMKEDKNDDELELEDCENENDDLLELEDCEDRVRFLVERFKKLKQLPRDWKYDPTTASTFVAIEPDNSALQKLPPPTRKGVRCCSRVIDPKQKFPKTTDVPLNDDERLIWSEFLHGGGDNLGLGAVDLLAVDEVKMPIEVDNPIVSQIGNFAVAAFNEAVEMYVKKGEDNNIHDIDIMKCNYLKMRSAYYFYILIEAIEERKHGVYEAKVKFDRKTHSKTLSHFVLTDRKPQKPPGKKGMTKRKTHPDTWLDGASIKHSWMRRRLNKSICRGYDYRTPWGTGFP